MAEHAASTSGSPRHRTPLGGALVIGLSLLGVAGYLAVCVAYGLRNGVIDLGLAAILWLVCAATVSRLWHRRWWQLLTIVGLAAVSAGLWSLTVVDFPPRWVESRPALGIALLLAPLLLASGGGAAVREWPEVSAALVVLLASAALVPLHIANVASHVAGGWREYSYPSPLPALIWLSVGLICAAAGARLLRRFGAWVTCGLS